MHEKWGLVARTGRARAEWLKAGVLGAGDLQSGDNGTGVESSRISGMSSLGRAKRMGGAQSSKAAGLGAVLIAQHILGGTGIKNGKMSTNQRVAGGAARRVDGCRGRCIDQLAAAFGARRNAVSRWLSRWQRFGLSGLTEGPRAGRPPKLPEVAQKK